MFGFSLGKLLLTAVIILAVWYGFKLLSREGNNPKAVQNKKNADRSSKEAEELVHCKKCGSYVTSLADHDCLSEE